MAICEVLRAGPMTTIQDWPGRLGYWKVGVPPSGPMDDLSFRLANMAVGNSADAAGLEATLMGPSLRFDEPVVVAVTQVTPPSRLISTRSPAPRVALRPPLKIRVWSLVMKSELLLPVSVLMPVMLTTRVGALVSTVTA